MNLNPYGEIEPREYQFDMSCGFVLCVVFVLVFAMQTIGIAVFVSALCLQCKRSGSQCFLFCLMPLCTMYSLSLHMLPIRLQRSSSSSRARGRSKKISPPSSTRCTSVLNDATISSFPTPTSLTELAVDVLLVFAAPRRPLF